MELLALLHMEEKIIAVDEDSGETRTILEETGGGPDGIAVHGGYIYYSTMGTAQPAEGEPDGVYTSPDGGVHRVPFNGTEATDPVEHLLAVDDAHFTTGKQLVFADGALYVADREGHKVVRINHPDGDLDDVEVDTLVATDPDGGPETTPVGVCVHDGTLYWTQKGPRKGGKGRIFAVKLDKLDPANPTDWLPAIDNLPEPIDLAVVGEHLYWTDRGAEPDGNSLNRAPLDNLKAVEIIHRGFKEAIGLVEDEGAIFVSDLNGEIRVVFPETGEYETIVSLGTPVTGLAIV